MANEFINRVFGSSKARPAVRAVLLALADRANEQGLCWPSIADIAQRAGGSERQTQRAIAWLVANGEIEADRRGGNGVTGRYRIILPETPKGDIGVTVSGSKTVTPASPLDTPKGDISGVKGDTSDAKGDTSVTRTLNNHKEPSKREKRRREPAPVWDTLLELFSEKVVTPTDRGRINRLVKDFRAKGATPDDMRLRADRYRRLYPGEKFYTAAAVLRHWDKLAKEPEDGNHHRYNGKVTKRNDITTDARFVDAC